MLGRLYGSDSKLILGVLFHNIRTANADGQLSETTRLLRPGEWQGFGDRS
jgi:hypothetical protein